MKKAIPLLILFAAIFAVQIHTVQKRNKYHKEIIQFQEEMNKEFADPATSPLTSEDLAGFKALEFFPINGKYCVKAQLSLTPDESSFGMPTTTDRLPEYKKYGTASFKLDGKEYSLNIYQNQELIKDEAYKDHLFLPFKDLTNGQESYGGGRYLDLQIPQDDYIILDFNKAYNPYCAYNHAYSCPIPPVENHMPVKIMAGARAFH